jgi:hypothetical protein
MSAEPLLETLLVRLLLAAEQAYPLHGDLVDHHLDRATRDDMPATVPAAEPNRLGQPGASRAALLACRWLRTPTCLIGSRATAAVLAT